MQISFTSSLCQANQKYINSILQNKDKAALDTSVKALNDTSTKSVVKKTNILNKFNNLTPETKKVLFSALLAIVILPQIFSMKKQPGSIVKKIEKEAGNIEQDAQKMLNDFKAVQKKSKKIYREVLYLIKQGQQKDFGNYTSNKGISVVFDKLDDGNIASMKELDKNGILLRKTTLLNTNSGYIPKTIEDFISQARKNEYHYNSTPKLYRAFLNMEKTKKGLFIDKIFTSNGENLEIIVNYKKVKDRITSDHGYSFRGDKLFYSKNNSIENGASLKYQKSYKIDNGSNLFYCEYDTKNHSKNTILKTYTRKFDDDKQIAILKDYCANPDNPLIYALQEDGKFINIL